MTRDPEDRATGAAADRPAKTEERRAAVRKPASHRRDLLSVRVRPGIAATLVDLSASGAAVDAERRLVPGRWVHVQLAFLDATITARGRVVRSHVTRIAAGRLVYRCGLQFDRPLGDPTSPERPRRARSGEGQDV